MEQVGQSFHAILSALTEEEAVETALMKFVRQIEATYADTQDIVSFVFALRCFFCWHRATELIGDTAAISRIQAAWVADMDAAYTSWIASMDDDPGIMKWAKWTFQAKTSLLKEFLGDS